MKLLEHKQRELQRISAEIERLSHGNPQQQRKCARLKREYEELRKMLGVAEGLEESAEREDSSENTSSFRTDESIYLDEQHPEVKPIQKDQYGVYEQVRNIQTVEERMLKRKKIESEAGDAFNIRIASLCELEADIDNIVKLERQINKIDGTRRICVTAMAEMNLTTKKVLFNLMGFVVNILRNALYIIAWIRDSVVYYTEGSGCMVDSYKKDPNGLLTLQRQISIFEERKCNIYGQYSSEKLYLDILFAYGEKSIAVIRHFSANPQKHVLIFKDWIQALHVFNKQNKVEHIVELVALSVNNAVELLRLDISGGSSNGNIEKILTVKSDYKAIIMHSVLDGDSWNTLRTVIGTVAGDIIISHPSKSSSFLVLKHHTGMIFGLLIKFNFLFSISDDRSLHMWELDNARHLDECYGHPTRPFSICDGPENILFTGGQDGSICVWMFSESVISLLKLIDTGHGVIRSLLFMSGELFFGTDCGFFGSITFPENIKNMQTMDVIYPNISVQSFVALSQQHYYILDSQGTLFETNAISVNKVLQCNSARSNSLKLSPCRKFVAFSGGIKLYVVRECMSSWKNYTLRVDLQEIISCVAFHDEQFFLGTRKGSVVVVDNFEMKQIIKRAHGRNDVTDVKFHGGKLLSIGRDGKLCIWRQGSQLHLLSCSRLSTAIEMEWPCKFLETTEHLYVAGFRGSNFILVNYNTGHCVCNVWCGGRRRSWCLSMPEGNRSCGRLKSICFEFVIKRRISRIILGLNDLHIIKVSTNVFLQSNLHLSSITSVATVRINQKELYVTGGLDGALVLSRFANTGCVEVIQRLQAHSSSVCCVCVMGPYLISVGGKSEIFIWYLEAGILHIWSFSESVEQKRHEMIEVEKCGLSALAMYNENDLYIGVGSESGAVTILQIKKNWNFMKSINCWHSATCTDLCLFRTSESLLVISIALDCRLAVFAYSLVHQTNLSIENSLFSIAIFNLQLCAHTD
uniref:tRNA (34-2'-O)-methyltransferase regulator WDR6 n=1 Tax=Setaria digitata TaxID=48799 RepID=A0A915PMQ4_9BILA